jgi:hypothetical protein
MISAAEARKLSKHIWTAQLEQIERAIKEAIIIGGIDMFEDFIGLEDLSDEEE